jgi:preprotein translocase subunit SecF
VGALSRLYRGETKLDMIGTRKRWYVVSAVILLISVLSLGTRGFNFGIEFAGGNQFMVPVKSGTTVADARSAAESAGVEVASVQAAGRGAQARYVIKTGELSTDKQDAVETALSTRLGAPKSEIDLSEVSSSWGNVVTRQALIGLVVFLVLVAGYLWIRFEQKMAIAALLALVHDLVLTAGIYSLVGFEVTPSTVIGALTILGYSLYDTVVVFDKVQENTKGLLGTTRSTYAEAANLAVNQTLMRSINTSLIGLLPVAGLLFVGAGLLGVGTLKDLALVLFVGMATGAYSSLFIATPLLVDFKRMEPRYKAHEKRVLAKRSGEDIGTKAARRQAKRAAEAKAAKARRRAEDLEEEPEEALVDDAELQDETAPEPEEIEEEEEAATRRELAGSAPRPGARPSRPPRKRTGTRSSRSGGKRKR